MKTPANVTRAIKNYSEQTCREAYDLNRRWGEGANSISHQVSGLNTTRQADAAINAGCWLVDQSEYVRFYTEYVCPPIPVRSMDWQATRKGYDEGDLIGRGATEQDAINDLLEQEQE